MERLEGRTAFITGGARGIGLGIARALAREGVTLAIADIDPQSLEEAKRELSARTTTETFVLDVRARDQYAAVADEVERRLGPVSLLFNNAGVAGGPPAAEMTYEMWDWILGVNLMGVINGIQTFLPRMIDRGGDGYIVNTSSGAGVVVAGSGVMYSTSKFAVVGLSESLRYDLARYGIGVSVLCPGYVATNILDNSAALSPVGARATARRERSRAAFAGGTSIDTVGDLVIAGIKADRLYIFTDNMIAEFLERRHRMLTEALLPVSS